MWRMVPSSSNCITGRMSSPEPPPSSAGEETFPRSAVDATERTALWARNSMPSVERQMISGGGTSARERVEISEGGDLESLSGELGLRNLKSCGTLPCMRTNSRRRK
ncbi:hypothetical protein GSI_12644 [Ganoderma sinense ZZ0214-1]|uniref:Uncharacterized protein n=1 Tax=Ganoderma sinense ZZ0214-1 TaxID=1077348 RepID=A0A2G8RTU5_9APHY|nr:hypothetical protein GSI_12644 [Ganoderma sinense ZZ0214-1]